MSEMVERVAMAKWARRQAVARQFGIEPPLADWADEIEALREEVRAETRCGIEAMREPTYPMIEAGGLAIYERNGDPTPEAEAEAQVSWPAMIDAALGDK